MPIRLDPWLMIVVAGAFSGSALLPLKFIKGWRFEATWLLYALLAYLVAPWIVGLVSVPHLAEIYVSVGARTCAITALFGFGWGIAVVLNGIAVTSVGLALATAILMGSSIAIGSLGPLLLRQPERLSTPQGLSIMGFDAVMLIAVGLCAWGGELRGRNAGESSPSRRVTTRGILLCLVAGILSTSINLALTYGAPIASEAARTGVDPINSPNAIWSLAVGAGALPSVIWCVGRLAQLRGHRPFGGGQGARNVALCILMAGLWYSGTLAYGAGTSQLGALGTTLGWPVYMSAIIVSSTVWGWLAGEWTGAPYAARFYLCAGVALQVFTIFLLSRSA